MKIPHILSITALALAAAACAPSATVQAPAPANPAPTTARAPSALPPVGYRPEFGTMWTFDAPPLDYWRQTYGFAPDQAWLDRVRAASVRLSNCSSSFVSANGLVLTNHHCVRECTVDVSPPDTDYIETGFVAPARRQEKKCPGMYVDELVSIENVTDRVRAAVTATTPAEEATQRTDVTNRIQTECRTQTGLTCQVVSLYHGGMYSVYRYKRYDDVRLVFVPEEAAAAFGGDPDNFTFPRHDIDAALLRVYVNDKPHTPAHFLRWSPAGASEGELVFVVGNPGSTGRLNTYAQLEFLRDIGYPTQLASFDRALSIFREFSKRDEATQRALQNYVFSLENSQKAITGYRRGLTDSSNMRRKADFESEFRARLAADPKLAIYSGTYDAIGAAQRELASFDPQRRYHSYGPSPVLAGSRLLVMAGQLVRVDAQAALPDSARLTAFRGNLPASVRAGLLREQAIDTALEIRSLASHLKAAQTELPADDPFLRAALGGRTPEQAAAALVRGSRVGQLAFRKSLLDGGPSAISTSSDPLIVLARAIDPLNRTVVTRTERLNAVISANTGRIGRALFETYGTALPPDATFTLRITDGVVKGYPSNGTFAPYKTTFHGLYDRAASFDNKEPWRLPKRWVEKKDRLDLTTPYNFVSTNDIIGGNSGSPVINRKGEVVGVAFDGNIESLPNRFLFLSDVPRTVSVHSRAITELLRKMYDAPSLADELEGK